MAGGLEDLAEDETLARAGALKMPDGHRAQLADIVEAINEGDEPSVGGEDGYRALKFVLDVYEAAGLGQHGAARATPRPR